MFIMPNMTTISPLIDSIEHAQCKACSSFVHKIFKVYFIEHFWSDFVVYCLQSFFRIAAFLFKKCEYKQSNPLFANCSNFNTNLNTNHLFISLCAFGIIVECSVYTIILCSAVKSSNNYCT